MIVMLAYSVFFLAVSSGSIFCCARYGRKYEEILPITCMGIVLVLFIFGILGILKVGIFAVMLLVITLYLLSAVTLITRKNWCAFLSAAVTPGSVIFLGVCVAFAFLNRGRVAYGWDEFSHWADIVKVMTILDDFGTNPASHSYLKYYPPGMALFQYFLQKILLFFRPDSGFHEASLYMAFQVFFASLLLPFFKGQSFRYPLRTLLFFTGIFIAPLQFFGTLYTYVFIDPILSFLAGAGFAAVFLNKDRDWVYSLYIWLLCSTLILTKESGLFFAPLLAAAYCISIFDRDKLPGDISLRRTKCLLAGCGVLFVSLPKLLWNFELKTSGALIPVDGKVDLLRSMLDGKVDFVKLWQVLTGRDTTYLSTVFDRWRNALFTPYIYLGHSSIAVSYFTLFLAICLFAFLLYRLFAVKEPQFRQTRRWVLLIMLAEIVIFVFGLCVMYMFKFIEYEATQLASFTRYVNTVFLAAWITVELIVFHAIDFVPSSSKKRTLTLVLLIVFLAIAPFNQIDLFVHRYHVKASAANRAPYVAISAKINDVCDSQSTIYFVSQENSGFDYWVTKYNVRPNIIDNTWYWSIGEGPFYDGDIWTAEVTAEQWQKDLIQNYDYVVLYQLNDYFYEHYSALFEDPSLIAENSVYLVDKESGLLVFCK